jgi:hypothetical protein
MTYAPFRQPLATHSMRALLIQRDNQSLIEENVDLRTKCKQATEEVRVCMCVYVCVCVCVSMYGHSRI